MNKSGLIDAVSKTTSLPKREAEYAVNALVHIVSSEVRAGRRVVISGFGSFNPTHRGARMGRNPQTGSPVRVAASRGVRFAASGSLKDVINGKTSLTVPPTAVAAKKGAVKGSVKQAVRAGTGSAKRSAKESTTRGASRSPRGGSRQVVGRTSARRTTRAPARKAARISARKAAGRPPARTAIKRSAKKAVRRA